jgi:hypothetical protein
MNNAHLSPLETVLWQQRQVYVSLLARSLAALTSLEGDFGTLLSQVKQHHPCHTVQHEQHEYPNEPQWEVPHLAPQQHQEGKTESRIGSNGAVPSKLQASNLGHWEASQLHQPEQEQQRLLKRPDSSPGGLQQQSLEGGVCMTATRQSGVDVAGTRAVGRESGGGVTALGAVKGLTRSSLGGAFVVGDVDGERVIERQAAVVPTVPTAAGAVVAAAMLQGLAESSAAVGALAHECVRNDDKTAHEIAELLLQLSPPARGGVAAPTGRATVKNRSSTLSSDGGVDAFEAQLRAVEDGAQGRRLSEEGQILHDLRYGLIEIVSDRSSPDAPSPTAAEQQQEQILAANGGNEEQGQEQQAPMAFGSSSRGTWGIEKQGAAGPLNKKEQFGVVQEFQEETRGALRLEGDSWQQSEQNSSGGDGRNQHSLPQSLSGKGTGSVSGCTGCSHDGSSNAASADGADQQKAYTRFRVPSIVTKLADGNTTVSAESDALVAGDNVDGTAGGMIVASSNQEESSGPGFEGNTLQLAADAAAAAVTAVQRAFVEPSSESSSDDFEAQLLKADLAARDGTADAAKGEEGCWVEEGEEQQHAAGPALRGGHSQPGWSEEGVQPEPLLLQLEHKKGQDREQQQQAPQQRASFAVGREGSAWGVESNGKSEDFELMLREQEVAARGGREGREEERWWQSEGGIEVQEAEQSEQGAMDLSALANAPVNKQDIVEQQQDGRQEQEAALGDRLSNSGVLSCQRGVKTQVGADVSELAVQESARGSEDDFEAMLRAHEVAGRAGRPAREEEHWWEEGAEPQALDDDEGHQHKQQEVREVQEEPMVQENGEDSSEDFEAMLLGQEAAGRGGRQVEEAERYWEASAAADKSESIQGGWDPSRSIGIGVGITLDDSMPNNGCPGPERVLLKQQSRGQKPQLPKDNIAIASAADRPVGVLVVEQRKKEAAGALAGISGEQQHQQGEDETEEQMGGRQGQVLQLGRLGSIGEISGFDVSLNAASWLAMGYGFQAGARETHQSADGGWQHVDKEQETQAARNQQQQEEEEAYQRGAAVRASENGATIRALRGLPLESAATKKGLDTGAAREGIIRRPARQAEGTAGASTTDGVDGPVVNKMCRQSPPADTAAAAAAVAVHTSVAEGGEEADVIDDFEAELLGMEAAARAACGANSKEEEHWWEEKEEVVEDKVDSQVSKQAAGLEEGLRWDSSTEENPKGTTSKMPYLQQQIPVIGSGTGSRHDNWPQKEEWQQQQEQQQQQQHKERSDITAPSVSVCDSLSLTGGGAAAGTAVADMKLPPCMPPEFAQDSLQAAECGAEHGNEVSLKSILLGAGNMETVDQKQMQAHHQDHNQQAQLCAVDERASQGTRVRSEAADPGKLRHGQDIHACPSPTAGAAGHTSVVTATGEEHTPADCSEQKEDGCEKALSGVRLLCVSPEHAKETQHGRQIPILGVTADSEAHTHATEKGQLLQCTTAATAIATTAGIDGANVCQKSTAGGPGVDDVTASLRISAASTAGIARAAAGTINAGKAAAAPVAGSAAETGAGTGTGTGTAGKARAAPVAGNAAEAGAASGEAQELSHVLQMLAEARACAARGQALEQQHQQVLQAAKAAAADAAAAVALMTSSAGGVGGTGSNLRGACSTFGGGGGTWSAGGDVTAEGRITATAAAAGGAHSSHVLMASGCGESQNSQWNTFNNSSEGYRNFSGTADGNGGRSLEYAEALSAAAAKLSSKAQAAKEQAHMLLQKASSGLQSVQGCQTVGGGPWSADGLQQSSGGGAKQGGRVPPTKVAGASAATTAAGGAGGGSDGVAGAAEGSAFGGCSREDMIGIASVVEADHLPPKSISGLQIRQPGSASQAYGFGGAGRSGSGTEPALDYRPRAPFEQNPNGTGSGWFTADGTNANQTDHEDVAQEEAVFWQQQQQQQQGPWSQPDGRPWQTQKQQGQHHGQKSSKKAQGMHTAEKQYSKTVGQSLPIRQDMQGAYHCPGKLQPSATAGSGPGGIGGHCFAKEIARGGRWFPASLQENGSTLCDADTEPEVDSCSSVASMDAVGGFHSSDVWWARGRIGSAYSSVAGQGCGGWHSALPLRAVGAGQGHFPSTRQSLGSNTAWLHPSACGGGGAEVVTMVGSADRISSLLQHAHQKLLALERKAAKGKSAEKHLQQAVAEQQQRSLTSPQMQTQGEDTPSCALYDSSREGNGSASLTSSFCCRPAPTTGRGRAGASKLYPSSFVTAAAVDMWRPSSAPYTPGTPRLTEQTQRGRSAVHKGWEGSQSSKQQFQQRYQQQHQDFSAATAVRLYQAVHCDLPVGSTTGMSLQGASFNVLSPTGLKIAAATGMANTTQSMVPPTFDPALGALRRSLDLVRQERAQLSLDQLEMRGMMMGSLLESDVLSQVITGM